MRWAKCPAIDLMSEEEDGTRWWAVWMDCATSFCSRELTELCATPKYRAAHHRRMQKQTLCGAVGFWLLVSFPFVVWADYALYIIVV